MGSRGSICADKNNNIYLVLPGNLDSSLSIMRAQKKNQYAEFTTIWGSDGFDGEPLIDVQRLEESNVLSVFTRTAKNQLGESNVVVLDFLLREEE